MPRITGKLMIVIPIHGALPPAETPSTLMDIAARHNPNPLPENGYHKTIKQSLGHWLVQQWALPPE